MSIHSLGRFQRLWDDETRERRPFVQFLLRLQPFGRSHSVCSNVVPLWTWSTCVSFTSSLQCWKQYINSCLPKSLDIAWPQKKSLANNSVKLNITESLVIDTEIRHSPRHCFHASWKFRLCWRRFHGFLRYHAWFKIMSQNEWFREISATRIVGRNTAISERDLHLRCEWFL